MEPKHRLPELDALRGLAALAVVVHHNLLASDLLVGPAAEQLFASPLQSLTKGRQAVMFFFVLSGYVLARSLRGMEGKVTPRAWAGWTLQRTIRLGVPALASLLISALLYGAFFAGTWPGEGWWLTKTLWQEPPTFGSLSEQGLLVRSAFHYEMNNVLWSLAHEWRISVALPAIAAFAALRGRQAVLPIILVGLAAAGFAGGPWGAAATLGPGWGAHVQTTLYFVLPFAIGVALDRADLANLAVGRLVPIFGFWALAGLARMNDDLADYAASAILIWLALRPGILRSVLRTPALRWLGQISFSLYLAHELVLAPLHHQLHGSMTPAALCALSCVAALPAAYAFYAVIERPAHRLAREAGRQLGAHAAHATPRPA